jgi:DHA1 family bicyclomycin/chloramphenicol resistance-like MFS transporter
MPFLILSRLVQALGACAGPVVGRAIVRDVHGREGAARVLAYMSAAMALAPAVGPIIGGFLEAWFGWRANFVVLTLFGAAATATALAILPETNRDPDPRAAHPTEILATFGVLLRTRAFLGYMLCYTAGYGALFSFISGSSFVFIETVGLAPEQFGFCFAAMVAGYIGGATASARLVRRLGIDRLILGGGALAATAGLALAAVGWSGLTLRGIEGAIFLLAPTVALACGIGLVMANAMAGAIAPYPRQAGSAAALVGFVQMLAAALVGVAVGHLYDGSARAMTGAMALTTLVIPLGAVTLLRASARAARGEAD